MKTAPAKSPANDLDPIFAELNLDGVGKNLFIGHIDRVPFRMELVSNEQTIGLLFQTRFSKLKQPIPENPPAPAGSALDSLIKEKKADFSADEDRAWFNLFAAHELIDRGELLQVLKEFAASLNAYVDFDDQPCFACKQTIATQPIYHSEKLHLICDSCHERVNKKAEALTKIDPLHIGFSLLWSLIVSVIGGLIWALSWMAFEYLLGGRTLSTFVFTIAFAALGCVVAWPIALVFRKIPRRGHRLANVITTLTCILTAVIGEAVICGYYFMRELGRLPDLGETFIMWRMVMAEAGSFYVIGKIITLGLVWAFTKDWAKPNVSLEQVAAPTSR